MHDPRPTDAAIRAACASTVVHFRKQKGLSQERLALDADIPRSYMSGLEREQHTPSLETIAKMLPIFGITWVEFFQEFERALPRGARTRQTPMEQALEEIRKFMNQSGEPKWLADRHQRTLYVNQALLDFMGVKFEQVAALTWLESIHPDDRKQLQALNKKAYARRTPFVTRYRIRMADGQYQPVVQNTLPQFTPKGVFIGMLGTMIPEPER
jgi:PAS domain S-box-containing protein